MSDKDREKRPFACAFLVSMQLLAMALCVLIVANMVFEYQMSTPVPQCPLKATE